MLLQGKLNFSVVAWSTANGQQLEAIAVKKLAVGSDDPVVGTNVQMQYNGQIWKGQIMSLHGKLSLLEDLHLKLIKISF